MRLNLVLVTFALGSLAGCADARPKESAATSAEALRALAPAEIIGDLAFGQTSNQVLYTETPKYRAFRLQASAGDRVDTWIRSTNGDARAWLLDASFATVVSNDDADGTTRDAHLVATIVRGGTHYITFRESSQEDATFVVSLRGEAASCEHDDTCSGGGGGSGSGVTGGSGGTGGGGGQPAGAVARGSGHGFSRGSAPEDGIIETWGKGLWEGYASFEACSNGPTTLELVDGTGGTYPCPQYNACTRFERLPIPLTLRTSAGSFGSGSFGTRNVSYEFTRFVLPGPLRATFDAANARQVAQLATDIPGVPLTLDVSAILHRNFTNGNACSRIWVNNAPLTAGAPAATLNVTAPITIIAHASCVSARLSTPEDPAADFTFQISNIRVDTSR